MREPLRTFHEAFDEQAARTPGKAASVAWARSGRCSSTYRELRDRSLALANGICRLLSSTHTIVDGREAVLAVQLPRIHPDFVPLLLAASRCRLPFVLLSTDLPDKGLESRRNSLIMGHFQPVLHITDGPTLGAAPGSSELRPVLIEDLADASVSCMRTDLVSLEGTDTLCFMFTGGTQRTKAVEATHAMVLHERTAYKELWCPRAEPVVLAHTSVYWGASALGQLSIALAFGGCVVWTEASEVADLRRCISEEAVTVLGVVPDHLDLLAPMEPAAELPNVEAVFTWGERLPRRLAERWRTHPRAIVRELLIATEYWLCLWADPLGDGVLRTVGGTELLILTDTGANAEPGELGELCIAGPMVMAGYHFRPNGLLERVPEDVFYEAPTAGGFRRCFFRTRDLVRRLANGGLVYKGRADMMTKDKGKWVDMFAVEEALAQLHGIRDAKIMPDPVQEHYHAFVALDLNRAQAVCAGVGSGGATLADRTGGVATPDFAAYTFDAMAILDAARATLPARTQLWHLPELPRHPVTRKVDTNRLKRLLTPGSSSWPLDVHLAGAGAASATAGAESSWAPPTSSLTSVECAELQERLYTKIWGHVAWTVGVAALVWAVADREAIVAQAGAAFPMAVITYRVAYIMHPEDDDTSTGNRAKAMCAASWAAVVLAVNPPISLACIARVGCSYFSLTYGWLALTYADDARITRRSRAAAWIMAVVDEFPFWKLGALVFAYAATHAPGRIGTACRAAVASSATFGFLVALLRRRVVAWPVVFWTLGIGHQARHDCDRWVDLGFWRRHFRWQVGRVWSSTAGVVVARLGTMCMGVEALFGRRGGATLQEQQQPAEQSQPDAPYCARCEEALTQKWPAKNRWGWPLCDSCGALAIAEEEEESVSWIQAHVQSAEFDLSNGQAPSTPRRSLKRKLREVASPSNGSATYDTSMSVEPVERPAEPVQPGTPEEAADYDSEEQQHAKKRRIRSLEARWWYNCLVTSVEISSEDEGCLEQAGDAGDCCAACSEEQLAVAALVEEVEPMLKPLGPTTVLLGLDSLRVARLANAIRTRWAKSLTAAQVRQAHTLADLVVAIEGADKVADADPSLGEAGSSSSSSAPVDAGRLADGTHREYAVWYSPGQHSPMGHWVLRTEEQLDHAACLTATRGLVERHAALRVATADPLRYNSFIYDCAALFTLYAPLLEAGSRLTKGLRRWISSSMSGSWPRIRCLTREDMYGRRLPGKAAPYEAVRVLRGQPEFEHTLGARKKNLVPPGAITSYEVVCYLEDVWAYSGFRGRFTIMRASPELLAALGPSAGGSTSSAPAEQLVYVDMMFKEWGFLVPPGDDRWSHPPFGFPALYFMRTNTGAMAWLRLEGANEIRLCYRSGPDPSSHLHHMQAFRAAPRRDISDRVPTVVTFLGFCMLHAWADGNCYLPLVQDFLALYGAARQQKEATLPLPPAARVPFEELERRLLDTFHLRESPMRASIRGGIWKYRGKAYGYTLGLEGETMAAVTKAALRYHVPLDIALLGLVTCAMARADQCELIEYTLYAPMRDGLAEAMGIGLFADWRDLAVGVDFELATVLGTLMQVAHKIQHRQWTVFNALRKPERTVVNIHPLDLSKRDNFVHLGENMWRGGDQIGNVECRGKELNWARQPASFVIEQQDTGTWWILMEAAVEVRPPPWTRRFVAAFEEDVRALISNPLVPVHARPLPSDEELLETLSKAGGW